MCALFDAFELASLIKGQHSSWAHPNPTICYFFGALKMMSTTRTGVFRDSCLQDYSEQEEPCRSTPLRRNMCVQEEPHVCQHKSHRVKSSISQPFKLLQNMRLSGTTTVDFANQIHQSGLYLHRPSKVNTDAVIVRPSAVSLGTFSHLTALVAP